MEFFLLHLRTCIYVVTVSIYKRINKFLSRTVFKCYKLLVIFPIDRGLIILLFNPFNFQKITNFKFQRTIRENRNKYDNTLYITFKMIYTCIQVYNMIDLSNLCIKKKKPISNTSLDRYRRRTRVINYQEMLIQRAYFICMRYGRS